MYRRKFIQLITLAGAAGAGGLGAVKAMESSEQAKQSGERKTGSGEYKTVVYRVKGFSCITCAVGLDAMLQQQKGVAKSISSYPNATVMIEFDTRSATESSLKAFIADQGFTVEG